MADPTDFVHFCNLVTVSYPIRVLNGPVKKRPIPPALALQQLHWHCGVEVVSVNIARSLLCMLWKHPAPLLTMGNMSRGSASFFERPAPGYHIISALPRRSTRVSLL